MLEVRGQFRKKLITSRVGENRFVRTSILPDFIQPPSVRLARRGWRILAALFCLGCGALSGGMAAAEVVNPATLEPTPRLRQPGAGVRVGGAQPEKDSLLAPANADKMFITIRSVNVDGAFPELEEQTAALIGEIQGRRVSLAKVYEFARALREAYSKAGYWLALITIPPQNFQSGAIRIVVIDGFIEDLDLSTVPERARDLVRARLEPLVGERHLTLAEFQRRIILISDIAGVTGRSAIKKVSTGGWILTIDVTEKLVSAVTAVSNRLPWQVGTWQFSQTASVNNALGLGEQFYATASSSSDFDRFFDGTSRFMSYGAGGVVPIGIDGLRLGAGYVTVRQLPTPTPWPGTLPIAVAGLYERAYVQVSYPLILTLEQSLRVQATYDYTTNILRQRAGSPGFVPPIGFGFDLYRDRYSTFGFTTEWAFLFPWAWGGSATNTASYSHGLGGRTADNPLVVNGTSLSRPGASPGYNKFWAETRIYQPLPEGFQVSLIARAQTSFGAPLMLPEQLSLDGGNAWLSGFAAGTLNVDRGVVVRSELSRPFNPELWFLQNGVAAPYIFGAWGRGVREWPFIREIKSIEAQSVGGGLRINTAITGLPFQEVISVEFAKSFSNIPYWRSGYRTNFSFALAF